MRAFRTSLLLLALVGVPSLAQYLVGHDGTREGNSPGRPCVFPFIYKGIEYNDCITTDNYFMPWCATTSNFDVSRRWTTCNVAIRAYRTKHGNARGASCTLPFRYKGITYANCTTRDYPSNKPWCYTSPRRWGECVRYPDVNTTGGNVPEGTKCSFPFLYREQWIHGCIDSNNQGVAWCATTVNYDAHRQWGNCDVKTLKKDTGCRNTYSRAINTLSYGGVLQEGAMTVEDCKAKCNTKENCIGFDFDTRTEEILRCFIHSDKEIFEMSESGSDADQYTLTKRCSNEASSGGNAGTESGKPVIARAGNALPGQTCVFPFRYGHYNYMSCTSARWYTPWCAVTANYNRDGKWGECGNIPTV